jgi:hypothetical protein
MGSFVRLIGVRYSRIYSIRSEIYLSFSKDLQARRRELGNHYLGTATVGK